MAYRYFDSENEVKNLQPQPLSEVTNTKLQNAINAAEDKVDEYLAGKKVATPIILANLEQTQKDSLKLAAAKMVAAVLYLQHSATTAIGKDTEEEAQESLDKFLKHANLGITTPRSGMGVVNYQDEYVKHWGEPNDTAEEMDE